jgi:hypothetical protein
MHAMQQAIVRGSIQSGQPQPPQLENLARVAAGKMANEMHAINAQQEQEAINAQHRSAGAVGAVGWTGARLEAWALGHASASSSAQTNHAPWEHTYHAHSPPQPPQQHEEQGDRMQHSSLGGAASLREAQAACDELQLPQQELGKQGQAHKKSEEIVKKAISETSHEMAPAVAQLFASFGQGIHGHSAPLAPAAAPRLAAHAHTAQHMPHVEAQAQEARQEQQAKSQDQPQHKTNHHHHHSFSEQQEQAEQVHAGAVEGEMCCVICGYVGTRYHGLQKHENGPPTVEEELESALIKSGALVYHSSVTVRTGPSGLRNGDLAAVKWTHASRTDKGVHAVGQCIGVVLQVHKFGGSWAEQERALVKQVNLCLHHQARHKRPHPLPVPDLVVYALKKVPKGFYDDR